MIYLVGTGMEGPAGLAPSALSLLRRSDLIAGGRRHIEALGNIDGVIGRMFVIGADLNALEACIAETLKKKRRAVVSVLATGDPLLYGIGDFILRTFGKRRVRVIPGVSVIQEAFSRIKESAAGLKVASLHGRKPDFAALARLISMNPRTALFTDRDNTAEVVAAGLLRAGLTGQRVHVCEALGLEEERIVSGSLRTIAAKKFTHPLSVIIFVREREVWAGETVSLAPGLDDSLFMHQGNMITKSEIRVVALSKLAPPPDGIVWDIGACTGSVSIEAARLVPGGWVYAVEKDGKRALQIRENMRRFRAHNVSLVQGHAPSCLRGLPLPHAVFVGGGGEGIRKILAQVIKRLRRRGTVVLNAVSLDTVTRALESLRSHGLDTEFVQVSLSRGRAAGGLSMLSACNPVFIVKGVKK